MIEGLIVKALDVCSEPLNAGVMEPLRSEVGRRNLKIASIAATIISLVATVIVFAGAVAFPPAIALGIEIVIWGVIPGVVGLWQIYNNAYDLLNEKRGAPCGLCGTRLKCLNPVS